ncbi:tetratricopeptide repeat protein [bacterium BD-1]|nr:tetratricopeptide repeat protein [Ottowia caeni]
MQQRSFTSAQALLDRASSMAPHVRDVQMLQAILAIQTRQSEKGEQILRGILQSNPSDVDALANLGYLMLEAKRNQEALEWLDRAIQIQPRHAGLHLNRGVTLAALDRPDEAIQSYERSLNLEPRDAQTHFALGQLLQGQQDFQRAFASYQRALALNPGHPEALSNLLFTHHYVEDFSPQANHDLARRLSPSARMPQGVAASARPPKSSLRVGFVSADLREHPVGYFLEGVLAQLDRTRLSLYAYSNNIFEDQVSEKLRSQFTSWHVIEALNDQDAAALIRQDQIDVLIDLSGYTAGHRQSLFALRPAPLQISWLGYFSTTGQTAIDYVLADPISVPPEEEGLFVERIWRMPSIRYCFTPPPSAPAAALLPALERGHITFGSFQALSKINDRVLKAWAEILRRAPMTRLRIQSKKLDHPEARSRFEEQLKTCDLPMERVHLIGSQSRADYLAAYGEVDIVLDTFPYPGGTTTVEALWMGVTTLTLAQPGMLGRQGQSIMHVAGLPEWVASSEADYITTAVHWAQAGMEHLLELAQLRTELRERVKSTPLFDASQFARDFERAIADMWQTTPLQAPSPHVRSS